MINYHWMSGRFDFGFESHVGFLQAPEGARLAFETTRHGRRLDYSDGPISIDQIIELHQTLGDAIRAYVDRRVVLEQCA